MWGLVCFFENNSILFVHTGCNLSFISSVSACDSVSFLGPSVAKSAGLISSLIVGIYELLRWSPSYFAVYEFVGKYNRDVNIRKLTWEMYRQICILFGSVYPWPTMPALKIDILLTCIFQDCHRATEKSPICTCVFFSKIDDLVRRERVLCVGCAMLEMCTWTKELLYKILLCLW